MYNQVYILYTWWHVCIVQDNEQIIKIYHLEFVFWLLMCGSEIATDGAFIGN
jgi:hypothetical protein